MSQTRNCPVCGRPGLPPNCASCPQCDADLTCFQALDSLASPAAAEAAPPKRRFPWAAAAALAFAALLILGGLAASMKNRLSELDRQLAELKAAEQQAAAESAEKQEPVHAAEPVKLPPESKIQIDARVHIVNERETAPPPAVVPTADQGKDAAAEPDKQPEAKETKTAAVKPVEERKPAAANTPAAVQSAALAQPAETGPKAVQEAVRPQDRDDEREPLGAAMPPAEKPHEPNASEKAPESSDLADLPATPPVQLKPGYRKHRARPAVKEEPAPPPAAEENTGSAVPQQSGGTFFYVVKDGETALDIAERFYGDRKYYPVVMEQNPHVFLGFIRKNSTVRLFASRSEAEALYQRRTERRDGLLLWKYEVRPGETWRTIYARFFLPRYSGMIFYGNQEIAPGKTVLVILR